MADAPEPLGDDQRALLAWLERHDDRCPACAYELRGLSSPVCPECGVGLSLGVRAPGVRLGPWAAALLAPAMGLGFDGVVATIMLGASVVQWGRPPLDFWVFVGSLVALGAASAGAIAVVARARRWWTRQPPRRAWTRTVEVWLGVALAHAAVGAWLFSWLS
jgi:hypothetical protein